MREGKGTINLNDRVESVCAKIFETYPLAGELMLPDVFLGRLFERAQEIFDSIINYKKTELLSEEQDVLAMTIVQQLIKRNLNEDQQSDTQFWPYIFNQFGFKQDNDKNNSQRIYIVLRAAVRGAFLQHNRFFSSEKDTQQYYTSLRLHSLTPVQSMESLFEILLFFYMNDLDFTYTPEDPAFHALVKSIAYRWDKDIEQQEGLNIRSNALASGLKALFKERPYFMQIYCEKIVQKIDAIVRGTHKISQDSTLDKLLFRWYVQKDNQLLDRLAKSINHTPRGVRAVSESSVRLRYILENNQIYLSVPPIRLEDKAETYPSLIIYQGDSRIWSQDMDVYGRLSWTTRALQISLDKIQLDYEKPLNISAEIIYNGKSLLERDSKLHRRFMVFDESGREVSAKTQTQGMFYVFAGADAQINTGTVEPEWIDHDGQFFRVYIEDNHAVYVDGEELFLSKNQQNEVRAYPSVSKIAGLRGQYEGEYFDIYPSPFTLNMRLPEGKRSLQYRIVTDGTIEMLSNYCPDGQQTFTMDAPYVSSKRHVIQIIEILTGRVACDFAYAVSPNTQYRLEQKILYDDGSPVAIQYQYDGRNASLHDYPSEESDWLLLPTEGLEYDLEARLPMIRGTIMEKNLFALPPVMWREEILDTAFIKIQCSKQCHKDLDCQVYLGTSPVPLNSIENCFDLGNFLKTYKSQGKTVRLSLMVRDTYGNQDQRVLTEIALKEHFTECPVLMENGALTWAPERKYVGGSHDNFILMIDVPTEESPYTYTLNLKNQIIDRLFSQDFPCGEFPIKIIKKSASLFGDISNIVFEGKLEVGAPEQRCMLEKYLYLTRARCWDIDKKQIVILNMASTAGCLCNLQFKGYSIPTGEEIEYPEYTADLYFYNSKNQEWQYFNDLDREEYERINPVCVWIISEQMMVMTTVDRDAVMIDRQYNTIVNRALKLPMEDAKKRIILPDYFECRKE